MIQGCRPSSVTNQPVSVAMKPSGAQPTRARSSHLLSGNRRVLHQIQATQAATANMTDPAPTIMSKDQCTSWTFDIMVGAGDRKSTRLNSSHANISYAVFCLKKKKKHTK